MTTTMADATTAGATMTAMVRSAYGRPEVLSASRVPRPVPSGGEVLIRVAASSLNAGDLYALRGDPWIVRLTSGLFRPRSSVLGNDVAGTVEAVGPGVTRFRPGDAVFGEGKGGGYAEFAAVSAGALALKPPDLDFAAAAAVPVAGLTALQGLRDTGRIRAGQRVLIHGASGGVGTFAVQIAKAFGAEVTAVCSTRNVDQARALGADRVIDYTRGDFASDGERYDLILGANGDRSLADYKRALAPQGIYVASGGTMRQIFAAMLRGPLLSERGGRSLTTMGEASPNGADLATLADMLASGAVVPTIDRTFALADLPEAFAYFERGLARAKIVVTV
jgi:NADPH:quinone reductase-like Zn-dependent oxidoreductase